MAIFYSVLCTDRSDGIAGGRLKRIFTVENCHLRWRGITRIRIIRIIQSTDTVSNNTV